MTNFLQVIFVLKNFDMSKNILNIIVKVNFFSDLKFEYYCEYYPEILPQESLKQETKVDGKSYEIFFKKITGPWNI